MNTIHALYEVLMAFAVVVGIAATVTLAFAAAGALFERDKLRAARTGSAVTVAARQPSQMDDASELVLR